MKEQNLYHSTLLHKYGFSNRGIFGQRRLNQNPSLKMVYELVRLDEPISKDGRIFTGSKSSIFKDGWACQPPLEIEVFLELAEEWAIAAAGLSLAKCFSFCRSKRLLLLLVDRKTVLCNSSLLVCRLFSDSFQLTHWCCKSWLALCNRFMLPS